MERFVATPTLNDMQRTTEQTPRSPPATHYQHKASNCALKAHYSAMEETATEELLAVLHRESTSYNDRFDYFSAALSAMEDDSTAPGEVPSGERICEGWRRKIAEWCFEVVDHFEFDRSVVSIALHYLDRVVSLTTQSTGKQVGRHEFKLIAVASFYLAMKLHGESVCSIDGQRKKLRIASFVDLSRGLFSIETLAAKEREILELLQWKVNPPTTVHFVASLLQLLPSWEQVDATRLSTSHSLFEMARYLTELAVCDSAFSLNYQNSEIAYAAILCAMEGLQGKICLPYVARTQLINKMTFITKLCPQRVGALCDQLKDQCPDMFTTSDLLASHSAVTEMCDTRYDGTISPVSVCTMHVE